MLQLSFIWRSFVVFIHHICLTLNRSVAPKMETAGLNDWVRTALQWSVSLKITQGRNSGAAATGSWAAKAQRFTLGVKAGRWSKATFT